MENSSPRVCRHTLLVYIVFVAFLHIITNARGSFAFLTKHQRKLNLREADHPLEVYVAHEFPKVRSALTELNDNDHIKSVKYNRRLPQTGNSGSFEGLSSVKLKITCSYDRCFVENKSGRHRLRTKDISIDINDDVADVNPDSLYRLFYIKPSVKHDKHYPGYRQTIGLQKQPYRHKDHHDQRRQLEQIRAKLDFTRKQMLSETPYGQLERNSKDIEKEGSKKKHKDKSIYNVYKSSAKLGSNHYKMLVDWNKQNDVKAQDLLIKYDLDRDRGVYISAQANSGNLKHRKELINSGRSKHNAGTEHALARTYPVILDRHKDKIGHNVDNENIHMDKKETNPYASRRNNYGTKKPSPPQNTYIHKPRLYKKKPNGEGSRQPVYGRKVRSYPLYNVVRVSTGCSGTLLTPSYVLTAAHCIHDGLAYIDGVTTSLKVSIPDVFRHKRHYVLQVYLPYGWITPEMNSAKFDYAVLRLARPVTGSRKFASLSADMPDQPATLSLNFAGYPSAFLRLMWRSVCPPNAIEEDDGEILLTQCEARKGDSGSGVYVSDKSRYKQKIIGVVSGVVTRTSPNTGRYTRYVAIMRFSPQKLADICAILGSEGQQYGVCPTVR